MKLEYYKRLEKWGPELKGVFTLADLKIVFNELGDPALLKNLQQAVKQNILIKVIRGIYAVPDASLEIISSRINPESYISTGTVLARRGLIGSVPGRRVQAIKVGRPRTYRLNTGIIEHLSITQKYFFGFESVGGIKYADPEKALLDACYYRFKGKTLFFDPASDVDWDALDSKRLDSYLTKYDEKFRDFFNDIRRG